jgi:hypothetical protein
MTTVNNKSREYPLTMEQHFMDFQFVNCQRENGVCHLSVRYQNVIYYSEFDYDELDNDIPAENLEIILTLYGGILWQDDEFEDTLLTRMIQVTIINETQLQIRLATMFETDLDNQYIGVWTEPILYYETIIILNPL